MKLSAMALSWGSRPGSCSAGCPAAARRRCTRRRRTARRGPSDERGRPARPRGRPAPPPARRARGSPAGSGQRPADGAPAPRVEHDGGIGERLVQPYVGDVGDPELVGRARPQAPSKVPGHPPAMAQRRRRRHEGALPTAQEIVRPPDPAQRRRPRHAGTRRATRSTACAPIPSSRASALMLVPASMRRTTSSLNSRLNTRAMTLDIRSPSRTVPDYPCLSLRGALRSPDPVSDTTSRRSGVCSACRSRGLPKASAPASPQCRAGSRAAAQGGLEARFGRI